MTPKVSRTDCTIGERATGCNRSTAAAILSCLGLLSFVFGGEMGHKDRLPEGKRTAGGGRKGDLADPVLPVTLGTDLAPIDRLRQHLAFGDAELAKLRRLCEDRGINGNVVLEMLELEQSLAGMGKRRGIRPALRELIAELAADGGLA